MTVVALVAAPVGRGTLRRGRLHAGIRLNSGRAGRSITSCNVRTAAYQPGGLRQT